jgi:hypothetical protein
LLHRLRNIRPGTRLKILITGLLLVGLQSNIQNLYQEYKTFKSSPEPIATLESQLKDVRVLLSDTETVGYVKSESAPNIRLIQYALTPTLVVHGAGAQYTITNLSGAELHELMLDEDLKLIDEIGNGMKLLASRGN